MDKIPVEIIEVICNAVDNKVTLKAMRLVNKNFAYIAARYLFETLLVYQTTSNWRMIELIAKCPRLAPLVKRLKLVTMTTSGDDDETLDEWRQRTQGHRLEGHLRKEDRGAAVAELVEPLNDKLAVVLGLQRRYQSWLWWDESPEAIERIVASYWMPRTTLSLPLPALSEIETAWVGDLWKSNPDFGRRGRQGILRFRSGEFFGRQDHIRNAHLSFALLVLNDSELKITTLELHQCREILLDQIYSVPILISLKKLKLHFRHPFDEEHK